MRFQRGRSTAWMSAQWPTRPIVRSNSFAAVGGGEGKRDAEHGDGGGFAVNARPAGVVEITGNTVRWKVPFDLNRAITGTQLVVVAYLVLRWLTDRSKARAAVEVARLSNPRASD